jgi:hypothetical protein
LRLSAASLKITGSVPDEVIAFFNVPNPSNCSMVLRSAEPLTEMCTWTVSRSKGLPVGQADNLTAICDPIIKKMWELQHLAAVWANTAFYRNNCAVFFFIENQESILILMLMATFKRFFHSN